MLCVQKSKRGETCVLCEHHKYKYRLSTHYENNIMYGLTVAETLPEKALNSTAAAETKSWSFILMFTLISDQNYERQIWSK
jgi:hypothetical protein